MVPGLTRGLPGEYNKVIYKLSDERRSCYDG